MFVSTKSACGRLSAAGFRRKTGRLLALFLLLSACDAKKAARDSAPPPPSKPPVKTEKPLQRKTEKSVRPPAVPSDGAGLPISHVTIDCLEGQDEDECRRFIKNFYEKFYKKERK